MEEQPKKVEICAHVWKDLSTIMEDANLEESLYRVATGQLIDGLNYLRYKQSTTAHPLSEMLPEMDGQPAKVYPVVRALLLTYAKYGILKYDWKDPVQKECEPIKAIKCCKKYVDSILYESRTVKRLTGCNLIFLSLWNVIKPYILAITKDVDSSIGEESGEMGYPILGSQRMNSCLRLFFIYSITKGCLSLYAMRMMEIPPK